MYLAQVKQWRLAMTSYLQVARQKPKNGVSRKQLDWFF